MQFCSAVNPFSKTKKLLHYSSTRRRIRPFVISTLFVQKKIVSIPDEHRDSFLPTSTERCSETYKKNNIRPISICTSVLLIKASEWVKYDVYSLSFFLGVFENSSNVFDKHQSSNRTGIGRRSVLKDAQKHHQYINCLKLPYFNGDNCAGAGDAFHLEFEIPDGKIQELNASYGWEVAKSDLSSGF